ncbi:hypothetical protein LCGC14_2179770, partial [marine sediment metagenome]
MRTSSIQNRQRTLSMDGRMIMESWQASCDRAITNELDPFVVGVQRDKLCNGCDELFYKVYGCD